MAASVTYLLLGFLWIGWCALHSCLISQGFTDRLEKLAGSHFRFFRLGYNLFALLSLSLPALFTWSVHRSETTIFIWDGGYGVLRLALLAVGGALFIGGSVSYDLRQFIGITQMRTGQSQLLLNSTDRFEPEGILGVVRHPWYLGGIILVWAVPREHFPSTLLVAAVLSIYFVIGSVLEEQKLLARYGDRYRVYQQQVSMLLPLNWISRIFQNRIQGD